MLFISPSPKIVCKQHTFSVVRSAGSNVTNYVNPVKRDTVSIGNPGDNVTFRFVTDNPGPWFLHCHIDWHLDAWVLTVLVVFLKLMISLHISPTIFVLLIRTYLQWISCCICGRHTWCCICKPREQYVSHLFTVLPKNKALILFHSGLGIPLPGLQ